jgi:hypothetical protein
MLKGSKAMLYAMMFPEAVEGRPKGGKKPTTIISFSPQLLSHARTVLAVLPETAAKVAGTSGGEFISARLPPAVCRTCSGCSQIAHVPPWRCPR